MSLKLAVATVLVLSSIVSAQTENAAKPKDDPCSIQDLAVQAALGDTVAQYNLAVEFFRGDKVPRDLAKSAILWGFAVKAGDIQAHNNLGYLNYYGEGIKQNFPEGVRLWRIAAMQGFPESQIHLGAAYFDGKFLKKNYLEAYAWTKAGRDNAATGAEGYTDAELTKMGDQSIAELEELLTPSQLVLARKKAAEYVRIYKPRIRR